MKKLLFFFIIPFLSISQNDKINLNKSLFVKGIGYLDMFSPRFGAIVGVEKIFLKNQSFGVKFVNTIFMPRQENVLDKEGVIHDLGNYENIYDKSFIVEYKYYVKKIADDSQIYLSLYTKCGKRLHGKDNDFENDFYFRRTNYLYFGTAIGFMAPITSSGKWLIDAQISYFTGRKNEYTEYVKPEVLNLSESYNSNNFRFELLLVYRIDF